MIPLPPPLWAVHIGDGQITFVWCVAGFVVAGLLALLGAWRIREEEIPQLAVLTAAFFLTALIHVPVPAGPRTHLLLNGLLGIVLGRRAILAVMVGLFLQSALSIMEGVGFSTLGVNACVLTIPALAAWGVFAGLHRLPWIRTTLFRAGLVAVSTLLFVLSMFYAVTALIANWTSEATTPDLTLANQWTFHPATLVAALLLAALAAWAERRLDHAVEFPLGLLLGEVSVLATILLNGLVLLWGGTSNWNKLVLLTFVVHLPLAVVEGVILGFTVGFLARVRPKLLYGYSPPKSAVPLAKVVAMLFTPLMLLLFATPAFAHRLNAEYRVLPDNRIRIECWYDITEEGARGAKVQVLRADSSVLTEGECDAKGNFVFGYETAEPLKVIVNAGMGHGKELTIPATELTSTSARTVPPTPVNRSTNVWLHAVSVGVGLSVIAVIFGVAFLVLRLLKAARMREVRKPATDE